MRKKILSSWSFHGGRFNSGISLPHVLDRENEKKRERERKRLEQAVTKLSSTKASSPIIQGPLRVADNATHPRVIRSGDVDDATSVIIITRQGFLIIFARLPTHQTNSISQGTDLSFSRSRSWFAMSAPSRTCHFVTLIERYAQRLALKLLVKTEREKNGSEKNSLKISLKTRNFLKEEPSDIKYLV